MADEPSDRLPRTVVPVRYALEFRPDLDAARFEGQGEIQVEITEPTAAFVLNAVGLTLADPTLEGPGGAMRGTVEYTPEVERVTLRWPEPAAPGTQRLRVRFAGPLTSDLRGFYLAPHTAPDGTTTQIACTTCEPTDARRFFPCWDEPDMKAAFAITLVVREGLEAFSNGPEVAREAAGDGLWRIRFGDTMPMSTYLVAMVVGPLRATEPVLAGRAPVRVVARPELSPLTSLAQEEGVAYLGFFEEYFGIAYPGEKLDHVAVPEFAPGAMENLGCIVYREEALVVDRERSAPGERMQVGETIAHETAHMWFGDLVTMRWWNGIWLNEAFATFMQVLACDAVHPDWQVWARFATQRSLALVVDGLASTRPVEFPVGPPAEAMAMFDLLTYEKGGALLRMLEQYLGPDVFRQGITLYLTRHRYANAETGDLWDALEAASGEPVRRIMDSWVLQGGYPIIQAERSADGASVTLGQRPFRYLGGGEGTWQVPVRLAVGRPDGGRDIVRALVGLEPVQAPIRADATWVLANAEAAGFYRSAYGPGLWRDVLAAWPHLTAAERFGLADDVWAGVQAGEVDLEQAFTLWRGFVQERDPELWGALAGHLRFLCDVADGDDRARLEAFAREVARPVLAELGWQPAPDESVQATRLRARIIGLLGAVGADPDVRAEARARLRAEADGRGRTDASLKSVVAAVSAEAGDAADWERIERLYGTAQTPQDEARYLFALGAATQPELVRRTLDLYTSERVRTQDAPYALASLLANRHARADAWDRIERDWQAMIERFQPQTFQAVAHTISSIVDAPLADRVAAWVRAHPVPEAAPQFAQGLEFQAVNRRLAARCRDGLGELLGRP